jgi:hypothetical protein
MALHAKHYACIEAMLANPSATYVELAEIVGCNRNTITEWKRNKEFMEEYNKRLKEMWKDSEAIAVKTMINLASNGDFKASKYILDSMDYAPAQKIEADLNTNIVIEIGD